MKSELEVGDFVGNPGGAPLLLPDTRVRRSREYIVVYHELQKEKHLGETSSNGIQNKFSNLDKDLLVIHLKKKLSIEGIPIGRKVINHYLKEIQSGSPTLIKGMVDTVIHEIERVSGNYKNHSQELCSDGHIYL